MHGFLLIAHGSRRQASNDEVFAIIESLKPSLKSNFDIMQAAFLELCEPGIGSAIDDMVNKGAQKITVLPYFLNQGRHVTEDVPQEVMVKQSQYPGVTIKTLPYFGKSAQITDLLVKIIKDG